MKNPFIRNKGVTLLEVMLVLAIAASILVLTFQFYNRYRVEQNFVLIQDNIDTLFQSLRRFYQSNCQQGVLSPLGAIPVDVSIPFLINDATLFNEQLITNGFLSGDWPRANIEVDDTFGYKGYSVKLNPKLVESTDRANRACYQFDKNNPPQCYDGIIPNRKILFWQFEIAVKVTNVDYAQSYGPYIGANCIVEDVPANIPINCETDSSPDGQILVWQLMPSDPFLQPKSDNWILNPVVKNFNMLYTHDPMYEMYDPSAPKELQYYLCGG